LKQGSEDPIVMNNVAWQMATHRDARVRDGAEAVRWAQKAVSLTGGNDPIYLDTLAAAYAETGNFPRALATVKEALRLAKDQKTGGLMPGLLKARQRYQAGMPLRDGK
jgi:tetratricopeptide (TPR) repeat protein